MSESSNITIRLGINGGTDSPLTYEQLDTNFLELKSVIDDYNDHINSENPHDAIFIYYDNENSSLSSSDIQSALDEVDANVVNMQNQITTKLDKTSFEDHIDSNTAHNAVDIVYDNSNSTIQQDDVNAAIDQLDANYNANDVLNKIKSVDGSGSGLDADTLDGIDSLGFDAAGAADTAVSDHEATNDHPLATTSAKGFLSGADKTKIDTVEDGATADQTDAEIKIAYESNADTNEFSDAEKTKLLGIEDGATADQTKADIDALNIDADTLDGIDSLGFDAAGAADTAVSDHVALADPHSQYADQANTYTETEVDELTGSLAYPSTTLASSSDISENVRPAIAAYPHIQGFRTGTGAALTFAQAVEEAAERGARLLTIQELEAGVAAGAGSGYNAEITWTSSPAGVGLVYGNLGDGDGTRVVLNTSTDTAAGGYAVSVIGQRQWTDTQYAGLDGGANANFTSMPQVGGDPIVESGSNADGEFTKWADGTIVCFLIDRNLGESTNVNNAVGQLFVGTPQTWTHPVAFVGTRPAISGACGGTFSNGTSFLGGVVGRLTTTDYHIVSALSGTNLAPPVALTAIGRWK